MLYTTNVQITNDTRVSQTGVFEHMKPQAVCICVRARARACARACVRACLRACARALESACVYPCPASISHTSFPRHHHQHGADAAAEIERVGGLRLAAEQRAPVAPGVPPGRKTCGSASPLPAPIVIDPAFVRANALFHAPVCHAVTRSSVL